MNAVPALLPVSAAPERVLLCLPEVGEDIGGVLYWATCIPVVLEPHTKKKKGIRGSQIPYRLLTHSALVFSI